MPLFIQGVLLNDLYLAFHPQYPLRHPSIFELSQELVLMRVCPH